MATGAAIQAAPTSRSGSPAVFPPAVPDIEWRSVPTRSRNNSSASNTARPHSGNFSSTFRPPYTRNGNGSNSQGPRGRNNGGSQPPLNRSSGGGSRPPFGRSISAPGGSRSPYGSNGGPQTGSRPPYGRGNGSPIGSQPPYNRFNGSPTGSHPPFHRNSYSPVGSQPQSPWGRQANSSMESPRPYAKVLGGQGITSMTVVGAQPPPIGKAITPDSPSPLEPTRPAPWATKAMTIPKKVSPPNLATNTGASITESTSSKSTPPKLPPLDTATDVLTTKKKRSRNRGRKRRHGKGSPTGEGNEADYERTSGSECDDASPDTPARADTGTPQVSTPNDAKMTPVSTPEKTVKAVTPIDLSKGESTSIVMDDILPQPMTSSSDEGLTKLPKVGLGLDTNKVITEEVTIQEPLKESRVKACNTRKELKAAIEMIDIYTVCIHSRTANEIVNIIRRELPGGKDGVPDLQHLRRLVRPENLPAYLTGLPENAIQPSSGENSPSPSSKSGSADSQKSRGSSRAMRRRRNAAYRRGEKPLYLLICPVMQINIENLYRLLAVHPTFAGTNPLVPIPQVVTHPVPRNPPSSMEQANSWTDQYWPTIYRRANPFGPHPSLTEKTESKLMVRYPAEEVEDVEYKPEYVDDYSMAEHYMKLARKVAEEGEREDMGLRIGCVIVEVLKDEGPRHGRVIAVACDGRCKSENPLAHATYRAISLVGRKRSELGARHKPKTNQFSLNGPVTPMEWNYLSKTPADPDAYLMTDLHVYLTHEPCVMCSMALVHSRIGILVYGESMVSGGIHADLCPSDLKMPVPGVTQEMVEKYCTPEEIDPPPKPKKEKETDGSTTSSQEHSRPSSAASVYHDAQGDGAVVDKAESSVARVQENKFDEHCQTAKIFDDSSDKVATVSVAPITVAPNKPRPKQQQLTQEALAQLPQVEVKISGPASEGGHSSYHSPCDDHRHFNPQTCSVYDGSVTSEFKNLHGTPTKIENGGLSRVPEEQEFQIDLAGATTDTGHKVHHGVENGTTNGVHVNGTDLKDVKIHADASSTEDQSVEDDSRGRSRIPAPFRPGTGDFYPDDNSVSTPSKVSSETDAVDTHIVHHDATEEIPVKNLFGTDTDKSSSDKVYAVNDLDGNECETSGSTPAHTNTMGTDASSTIASPEQVEANPSTESIASGPNPTAAKGFDENDDNPLAEADNSVTNTETTSSSNASDKPKEPTVPKKNVPYDHSPGDGYGLFWRDKLNWKFLAFKFIDREGEEWDAKLKHVEGHGRGIHMIKDTDICEFRDQGHDIIHA